MDEDSTSNGQLKDSQQSFIGFYNVDDAVLDNFSLESSECVDILVDTLLSYSTAMPSRLSKIKYLIYDFSPLQALDDKNDLCKSYQTSVDCVDIDGFLYPLSIFSGKIDYSFSDKSITFYLLDEYKCISSDFLGIESHPLDYFFLGKVPTFSDFVVKKYITVSLDKELKTVFANCQGNRLILDGTHLQNIVDFDEEMLRKVSIDVWDKSKDRSFVYHSVKIDFDKGSIDYLKKYQAKDNSSVLDYHNLSFSLDFSILSQVINSSCDDDVDNLSSLFISKFFCKMIATDWIGIRLQKYKDKQSNEFSLSANKNNNVKYEYELYADDGYNDAKLHNVIRFNLDELMDFSPLADGGSFLNQLLLLGQSRTNLINILNKYDIKYNDEKETGEKEKLDK